VVLALARDARVGALGDIQTPEGIDDGRDETPVLRLQLVAAASLAWSLGARWVLNQYLLTQKYVSFKKLQRF
jgi:hypothetical protein